MFSEEVFINECTSFLLTNTYVDCEDVKTDIHVFISTNLPINMSSGLFVEYLAERIMDDYMEYNFSDMSSIEDIDDEDDILYRSADIWLAADTNFNIV